MKSILMTLYGPLETDARVLRSIKAANIANCLVTIITCDKNVDIKIAEKCKIINLPFKALGIKSFIRFCCFCFKYIFLNKNKFDIFYFHDYYSTIVAYFVLPFISKKKVVYDAHELILPNLKDKIYFRDKLFIYFEKSIVHKVDLIIEANKEREDIIKEYYSLTNTMNVLNITQYKFCKEQNQLKKEKILVYQGALTEERNLSFFIKAIKNIPEAKLMFIGDGVSMDTYKKMVRKNKMENQVIFTGRLSNEDMMNKLKECSIGIISYPFTNMNNIYCSPNKIFEYAAISLPFISTNQPFLKEVEKNYNIGLTFEFGNINSFVNNVRYIYDHYDDFSSNFKKFLSDYSYENELSKMINMFQNI